MQEFSTTFVALQVLDATLQAQGNAMVQVDSTTTCNSDVVVDGTATLMIGASGKVLFFDL